MGKAIKQFNKLFKYVPILKAKGVDVSIDFFTANSCIGIMIYPKGFDSDKDCYEYYFFSVGERNSLADEKEMAIARLEELAK